MNKLFLVTLLISISLGIILVSSVFAEVDKVIKPTTAYDRICSAQSTGEISLKESVLLRAFLLYAPTSMPEGSKFAPQPGEVVSEEGSGTGLYKDVHRVFPELNQQERTMLKSLSLDLEAIITAREKEERGK